MAVVEFQIRESKFLAYLKSELNQHRLPARTIPLPGLSGRLLERIECTDCTVSTVHEPGSGELTLDASLVIHHTTLADAKRAGSFNPPLSLQAQGRLQVKVSVGRTGSPEQLALLWSVTGLHIDGQSVPPIYPPGVVPLRLPQNIEVHDGFVDVGNGVVVVRLATRPDDTLSSPVTTRISRDDWAQLIPGQVFADVLAAGLQQALGSLPADFEAKNASGTWFPSLFGGPFASATVRVVARNRCVVDDLPIDLRLTMRLDPTGPSLKATVVLDWVVRSFVCELIGSLIFHPLAFVAIEKVVREKVSSEILGRSVQPDGFVEVGRDDDSITFSQTSLLETPSPRFRLTRSEVTDEGLLTAGRLEVRQPRRKLEGWVARAESTLDVDCSKKGATVAFLHPRLTMHDLGLAGAPVLFPGGVVFEPKGAWVIEPSTSHDWQELALIFADPPSGRPAAGKRTSVYLHTDSGLRWIDLGIVPEDRPAPEPAEKAALLSPCFAISDKWGTGVLNLDWLVDPPDVLYGFPPLREWTVALADLPPGRRVQFRARRGRRARSLGRIVDRRYASVQIVTEADETLEIRADGEIDSPVPTVLQRWITPWAEVALESEPLLVAATEGVVGLLEKNGGMSVVEATPDAKLEVRSAASATNEAVQDDLSSQFSRLRDRGKAAWSTTAAIDDHTVATTHGGRLLVGSAGPTLKL